MKAESPDFSMKIISIAWRARAVEILLQSSKQHFFRSQDCQSLVKDLEVAKFLKFFEKIRQRHLKY